MSWYRAGTVALTNGGSTVTGTGTLWADIQILNPGDIFISDNAQYEVASIQSNTELTLVTAYGGDTATGADYEIVPIGMLPSSLAVRVKEVLDKANGMLDSINVSTEAAAESAGQAAISAQASAVSAGQAGVSASDAASSASAAQQALSGMDNLASRITVSENAPAGGADGDIWFVLESQS